MDRPYAREPPAQRGRRFYSIYDRGDGTADVYLMPKITVYPIWDGFKEYDAQVLIVRGVVLKYYTNLEEDIRARYDAWCDSAEVMDL